MNKKERNVLIALATVIIAVLLYQYSNLFSVYYPAPITETFEQYETNICGEDYCTSCEPICPGGYTFANVAEFNTGTTNWKIEHTGGKWGECGNFVDSDGTHTLGGCCTTSYIYMNGELIDTIGFWYGGINEYKNTINPSLMESTSTRKYKYCSDGTVGTYANCTEGVVVYPTYRGWTDEKFDRVGECTNKQHKYRIIFNNESVEMEISNISKVYEKGKPISINYTFTNNIFPVKANLTVTYEVVTILGNVLKTDVHELNLISGKNYFTVDIPSNQVLEELRVTPILDIYYPTSGIDGLNFISGDIRPVSNVDSFLAQRITSGPAILSINEIMEITLQNSTNETNSTIIIINSGGGSTTSLEEEEEENFCSLDVKECNDGSFVGRDQENNCEFFDCPKEDKFNWGAVIILILAGVFLFLFNKYRGRK